MTTVVNQVARREKLGSKLRFGFGAGLFVNLIDVLKEDDDDSEDELVGVGCEGGSTEL